jgi:hypothetical protein
MTADYQSQIILLLQKIKHEQEQYLRALRGKKIYSILKEYKIVINELRRELNRLEQKQKDILINGL